jgi:putative ABC transport system permease protein
VTIGALLELALVVSGSWLIANQLFGVQPLDIATLASVALLIAIALLAAYVPARRAARSDAGAEVRNSH